MGIVDPGWVNMEKRNKSPLPILELTELPPAASFYGLHIGIYGVCTAGFDSLRGVHSIDRWYHLRGKLLPGAEEGWTTVDSRATPPAHCSNRLS